MTDGVEKMAEMAIAAGLLAEGETPSEQLLAYSYLLVHACAQIGRMYGDLDANAGDHIRAIFHPHADRLETEG